MFECDLECECNRYTPETTVPCSQWCQFLNCGCVVCDLAHRRSLAVLCMPYKIRCNPMHPLHCALPEPYTVPVCVTRGAVITHRHIYAPPRCRTSQYRMTFILLSVSLWNVVGDPVFDGVGLAGFKSRVSLSLLSFYVLVLWGWGLRTHRVLIALSQPCTANLF